MVSAGLIERIRQQYKLSWRGIHGVSHWGRVLENGLKLASLTGADVEVVRLFAVFHDACRLNEDWDPAHGKRGAELAAQLRGKLFDLPDPAFESLCFACTHHTEGKVEGHATVQTCWDADRLDLGRVGIKPHPNHLCTAAAKNPEMIAWAYQRSLEDFMPPSVTEWLAE